VIRNQDARCVWLCDIEKIHIAIVIQQPENYQ